MTRFALDLVWQLGRVRAVIVVLVVVTFGLLGAPQAQDVLVMLGQSASRVSWGLFVAGVCWLGLNAWFWARFALLTRTQPDDGAPARPARLRRRALLTRWLPRLLGLIPFLAVPAAMLTASHGISQGVRSMMGAEDSGAQVLARGAVLIAVLGPVLIGALVAGQRTMRRTRVPEMVFMALSVLAGGVGLVFYGLAPVAAGALFQPAPTILFAAAGLIAGATIITWLGARTGWPAVPIVLVFAFALAELRDAGLIADNHDVREVADALPARIDIASGFRRFLAANATRFKAPQPVPVVLVAASSGGLAAAYWTATILGDLVDKVPGFAPQLFAVSSVSGGSLGALETLAMLSEPRLPAGCTGIRLCTQHALAGDFLAPTLGSLLYPDLLQRVLPFQVFEDRAAALEQAWEAQWRRVTGDDRLAQPFLQLWADPHKAWPALLMNSTSVLRGDRLIASNLQFSSADMDVSIDAGDLLRSVGADLPASTAADTSARFPLFGPVGVLRNRTTGRAADLVVDGGYFEDFGATTLLETLDVLVEVARRDKIPVRFIVIQIIGAPAAQLEKPDGALLPRGVWGPLDTLLHTREARGLAATHALARRVATLGGVYAPLRLGFSPTGESAPLSWSLSEVARHVIDVQWSPTCRQQLAAEMGLSMTSAAIPAMSYAEMMTKLPCPPSLP
jgi:hypothetical protein